jgi:hypothetical protein
MVCNNTIVLGKETVIVGHSSIQAVSLPQGCTPLLAKERTATTGKVARSLLGGEFGTITLFQIGDKYYVARVEPHYHPPPPADTPTQELSKYPKPWGWHKGVTIYKLKYESRYR